MERAKLATLCMAGADLQWQVAIDLGSGTLELIPQEPAHTDGDVAVWLPSANILVMGDLMTDVSYPSSTSRPADPCAA